MGWWWSLTPTLFPIARSECDRFYRTRNACARNGIRFSFYRREYISLNKRNVMQLQATMVLFLSLSLGDGDDAKSIGDRSFKRSLASFVRFSPHLPHTLPILLLSPCPATSPLRPPPRTLDLLPRLSSSPSLTPHWIVPTATSVSISFESNYSKKRREEKKECRNGHEEFFKSRASCIFLLSFFWIITLFLFSIGGKQFLFRPLTRYPLPRVRLTRRPNLIERVFRLESRL